jgi:glycopeptide antibiotics resistance protein
MTVFGPLIMNERPWWGVATGLALIVVLVCTLWPFTFAASSSPAVNGPLSIAIGPELGPDILENTLLFLPFGFALTRYLEHGGKRRWVDMTAVLGASLALSYTIEALQAFLPGRVPSLTDVLANSAGGCLGFFLHIVRRDAPRLALAAYLVPVALVSIPLQWSTTLDWKPEFPLMVGNEHTGDRPWRGRVSRFSVLDRALSSGEVAQVLRNRDSSPAIAESVLASYELDGAGIHSDGARRLPPLAWRAAGASGIEPDAHRWLETTGPAAALTDRIKRTSAFTLLVTAATEETFQTGPARIVSVSTDTGRGNFTLAQNRSNLVFRLRTPLTGTTGSRPEFVVPRVFATRATRELAITYDGLDLLVYVDDVDNVGSFRLGLGAAACAPLFRRHPQASYACGMVYNALLFVPAGILLSRAGGIVARLPLRVAMVAAGIALWSLTFEFLLMAASGRALSWSNVAWTITFAATAAAAEQWHRRRRNASVVPAA